VATTADDSQEEPAEERERSFLASFSQADLKLFVVTFAGTVAANVVTVIIVAVALLLARPPAGVRPTPAAVLIDLYAVVIGLMTVGIAIRHMRGGRRDLVLLFLVTITGLGGLIFAMILLGYAVGVK
jgi:hypothetical protein